MEEIPVQLPAGMPGTLHKGMQSETEQGPPESVRILALTARMYAIVRKVAVPARSSVVKFEFRSASLKRLPIQLLAM